jgi:hypothetical protein
LVDPEEGHHPIARELIDHAARARDGAAHRLTVAVQEEDYVIGEFWLSEPGEPAQVGEQHRNVLLLSCMMPRRRNASTRLGARRDQRDHPQVVRWAHLTGKAHIGWRPDTIEDTAFFQTGGREGSSSLDNTHPAGRAAPPTTTHRGVWELGESARFEHTEADGHDDFLPLRIGDLDRLATSLSALAHGTRQQDGADSCPKDPRDHGAYTVRR